MRGGDIFWDFRSFNPPISRNNWANEYAEQAENRDDTLVIHSTYLDVPEEWLGSAFIEEAEILKEINYKAYEHEYLGLPVGNGGNVFPNVKHMDMTEMIDISTPYDKEKIEVPLWQTFDKIYTGLDWGFTVDPTRLVRCHYDIRKMDLYIFYEYNTLGTRNINIFEDIYEKEKVVSLQDLVTADSAEQKSIADFRAYGAFIRGAEKGAESVRYGIKWLQGRRNIFIDKNLCPRTYKEFINYEYMQDREGNFISEVPDKDNHCLVGDTVVNTPNGDFKIKDLVGKSGKIYAYDIENKTPVVAEFTNCRVTFENAEIWEITLENNTKIQCTYDHPVLTEKGYIKACELAHHKVKKLIGNMCIKNVEKLDKKTKVYDLEVPKYHNFAINGGIIVHNSIDAVRYAMEKFYKRRGK